MPVSAIGADFDQPLDIRLHFFAQIAFHHAFRFDDLTDAVDLVFAQVLNLFHRVDVALAENARGARMTNTENKSQTTNKRIPPSKVDHSNKIQDNSPYQTVCVI